MKLYKIDIKSRNIDIYLFSILLFQDMANFSEDMQMDERIDNSPTQSG